MKLEEQLSYPHFQKKKKSLESKFRDTALLDLYKAHILRLSNAHYPCSSNDKPFWKFKIVHAVYVRAYYNHKYYHQLVHNNQV